jgi:hypothetical protein
MIVKRTNIPLMAIILLTAIFSFCCYSQNQEDIRDKQNRRANKQSDKNGEERRWPESEIDHSKLVGNAILGSPTNNSITLNILAEPEFVALVQYGSKSDSYEMKTVPIKSTIGEPIVIELNNLQPNTKYFYSINYHKKNEPNFISGSENSFFTQRNSNSAFSFGVQGDSHPERLGKMFNPKLYKLTMNNAVKSQPDFYFMMGDDFSIDRLISNNQINQKSVENVYLNQRQYVEIVGKHSPLFLVNGNHEQAAKYLIDGTPNSPAVFAANARKKFYPLPPNNTFYSGDEEDVQHVGKLKDYYSFEWGNALFVVIDFYWHSDNPVDNVAGDAQQKRREPWSGTLGEIQYKWFKKTLEESKAKYKFVFTHHVLGTGRGGVERANLFEWGGYNQKGVWEFDKMRPGWEMPIHHLMVKNKVAIFFQGHDHIFVKQELDGVIYQSVPNPADDTYTAFNSEAYTSGDILPNSGFLNVTVTNDHVKVDYIRSFLSSDETKQDKNGVSVFSYTIK